MGRTPSRPSCCHRVELEIPEGVGPGVRGARRGPPVRGSCVGAGRCRGRGALSRGRASRGDRRRDREAAWARVGDPRACGWVHAAAQCALASSASRIRAQGRCARAPLHASMSGVPSAPSRAAACSAVALCGVRRRGAGRTPRDHGAGVSQPSCPFCTRQAELVFYEGRLVVGIWDQFPVSPGHALLIPRRHVVSWFDATDE